MKKINIKNLSKSQSIRNFGNNKDVQKILKFGTRLVSFLTVSLLAGRAFEVYVIEPKQNKRFQERFANLEKIKRED